MFIRNALSAVLAIAVCASFNSGAHASDASKSLTGADFADNVASGTTFVKFYSPQCGHCIKLAPTWEMLAVNHQDWANTKDFKFAEVNCLMEGDVCEDNNVQSYPNMQLFNQGKSVHLYQGGRSIEDLTAFVTTKSQEYEAKASANSNKLSQDSTVNTQGKVIVLDNKNYESSLKNGEPWLVEYYAPWCGHCKALAPTYEELAKELKGKVNVAKVDCPANDAVCRSQKVRGYPTIKLHQNGQASEFNGQRQLANMAAFAVGGTISSVKRLTPQGFEEIKAGSDVSFIYVYDANTNEDVSASIDKQSRTFYEQVSIYSTNDNAIARQLSLTTLPALVVMKDNRQYTYQGSLTDSEAVRAWIKEVKEPMVLTLDGSNVGTFLQTKGWIALGLFDPSQADATAEARKELIEAAHAYHGAKAESYVVLGAPLVFAILDAQQWQSYVRGAFGIDTDALPAVFVVNGVQEQYYAHGFDGRRVTVTKEALLAHIADIEAGLLTPKSQVGLVQKGFREFQKRTRPVQIFYQKHPTVALTIAAAMVLAMMRRSSPPKEEDPSDADTKEGAEKEGKEIKQD
ncbi:hypothetical protein BGX24_003616 [Mortierella sp. AD032]|nr:hypothetical protein BGX24_003616 [Mortierella sp. AD032]